jgi:hypothetical protein
MIRRRKKEEGRRKRICQGKETGFLMAGKLLT